MMRHMESRGLSIVLLASLVASAAPVARGAPDLANAISSVDWDVCSCALVVRGVIVEAEIGREYSYRNFIVGKLIVKETIRGPARAEMLLNCSGEDRPEVLAWIR